MYHKVREGRIAYFDVDHTLIIWEMNPSEYVQTAKDNKYYSELRELPPKRRLSKLLEDQPESLTLISPKTGNPFRVRPIWTHVSQLIQQRLKGLNIVVWSAGGSDWAEAVVNGLFLDDFVDVIMTKPDFLYDDSKPKDLMGRHFFFAWDEINAKMKGLKQAPQDEE